MTTKPREPNDAWVPVAIPPICERAIGFSIPKDGAILVISYEGMHLVRLSTPATVETDDVHCEYDLYDADKGLARFRDRDWEILGLHGGRPILLGQRDERLALDTETQRVAIVRGSEDVWSCRYENFSGDWAAVTFSPDGRFIVLGCPYGFDFRVWKRHPTGATTPNPA